MKKILLFVTSFFLFFQAFSQDFRYNGELAVQAGLGMPGTHDNEARFLAGSISFANTFKAYFDDSMVNVEAILIADDIGSQSSNGISAFVSDDGHFSLKLKEAYYDYNGGFWALRAGRQISAWGKADGIQITDILCPQDESNIIASTYKESRQGIDALRLSFIGEKVQADAYWIPFFTPSTMPLAKNNPLRRINFPDNFDNFVLETPSRYDDFELPEKKFANSEYAARLGMYFSSFDLSFYGFYGWDDMPFISYTPGASGISVSGSYERMAMFGVDSAIPVGDFVFRLESAFFPKRKMQTSAEYQAARQIGGEDSESFEDHNQILALAGLDWSLSDGWTINMQYIGDGVFGKSENLDRKSYNHQLSLSLEKSLLNETLTLSGLAFLDLRDFSSNTELSAEYSLSDSIKLSIVGNIFLEGPDGKDGLYGAYHDLTCLTLRGKISF